METEENSRQLQHYSRKLGVSFATWCLSTMQTLRHPFHPRDVTKVFNILGAASSLETTFSKLLQTISQNLFKVRE